MEAAIGSAHPWMLSVIDHLYLRLLPVISLRIPWALSSPLPLPLIGGHQRKCVGDTKKEMPSYQGIG